MDPYKVRQLQAGLRVLGYEDVGSIDGDFGPLTEAAALTFLKQDFLQNQDFEVYHDDIDPDDFQIPRDFEKIWDAVRIRIQEDDALLQNGENFARQTLSHENMDTDDILTLQTLVSLHGFHDMAGGRDVRIDMNGVMSDQTERTAESFLNWRNAITDINLDDGNGPLNAEQVKMMQGVLWGYEYFDVGPIDGIAGPKTHRALNNFIQDKGLDAKAEADEATLLALAEFVKNDPNALPRFTRIFDDLDQVVKQDVKALQAIANIKGFKTQIDGHPEVHTCLKMNDALADEYEPAPGTETRTVEITPEERGERMAEAYFKMIEDHTGEEYTDAQRQELTDMIVDYETIELTTENTLYAWRIELEDSMYDHSAEDVDNYLNKLEERIDKYLGQGMSQNDASLHALRDIRAMEVSDHGGIVIERDFSYNDALLRNHIYVREHGGLTEAQSQYADTNFPEEDISHDKMHQLDYKTRFAFDTRKHGDLDYTYLRRGLEDKIETTKEIEIETKPQQTPDNTPQACDIGLGTRTKPSADFRQAAEHARPEAPETPAPDTPDTSKNHTLETATP